ncbi:MAG: dihydropteroate synthase [Terriglobia bacterium]
MAVRTQFVVHLPSRKLLLGQRTLIMGILNVTPDSFFDGGRYLRSSDAVARGLQMEEDGADLIDVGGESTRPPHRQVLPAHEEIQRVIPVIEALKKRVQIPIAIDTYKSAVAEAAVAAGAELLNDIGGFRLDSQLPSLVARTRIGVILMHSRGKSTHLHSAPGVKNIVRSVLESLERSIGKALKAGIRRQQLIADPGLGFGKRAEDNWLLLKHLGQFQRLDVPLLVGASRKSFIGNRLGEAVEGRLIGSLACASIAVLGGAHILRVHDVKDTVQLARVCDLMFNPGGRVS